MHVLHVVCEATVAMIATATATDLEGSQHLILVVLGIHFLCHHSQKFEFIDLCVAIHVDTADHIRQITGESWEERGRDRCQKEVR